MHSGTQRRTAWLIVLAGALASSALLVVGLTVPIHTNQVVFEPSGVVSSSNAATLVEAYGVEALLVLAAPFLVAVAAARLARHGARRMRSGSQAQPSG